jgi:tRNA 2-thiouridine synthesizing protein C
MGHTGQKTAESENIGTWLEVIHDLAGKSGLTCLYLACDRCASARGYSTWDDGKGAVISTCAIKPFHIRDMHAMVDRFSRPHIILSENAGSIQFAKRSPGLSFDRIDKSSAVPPVTIIVTQSPYSTEHVYGAISFATATAHQGILTRVIFIEDGVYAVAGHHRPHQESILFPIPDLINAVAGNANLHFFVLQTSLQKRGLTKNPGLNAVIDIGFPGLGKILFYPPGNVQAEHQRVLIF